MHCFLYLGYFGAFWELIEGREGPRKCCFDLLCFLHLFLGVTLHVGKRVMIFVTQDWAFLLKWLSLVDYCTLVCLCLTSVVGLDAGTESSTTSAKFRSSFGIGYPEVRWIVKNRPTLQSFN